MLSDPVDVLQAEVAALRRELRNLNVTRFERAQVTSVSPLAVALDSDPIHPLDGVPENRAGGLAIGDFVDVRITRGRAVIMSRVGGPKPNTIAVSGVAYQRHGYWNSSQIPVSPSFTAYGSTYARSVTLPLPYTPPDGCYFEVKTQASTGFTTVENVRLLQTSGVDVRIIQVGSDSVSALSRIAWELIPTG